MCEMKSGPGARQSRSIGRYEPSYFTGNIIFQQVTSRWPANDGLWARELSIRWDGFIPYYGAAERGLDRGKENEFIKR